MPKARYAIRLIERDGWRLVRIRGSHRHFRQPDKAGTGTVAGRDLAPGSESSNLKQADLDKGALR